MVRSIALYILALSVVRGQEPAEIIVAGRTAMIKTAGTRPLTEALYLLSKTYYLTIGFEEAPYRYTGDLVDRTSPKYVPKSADDRAYFPRGGPLSIAFQLSAGTQQPADINGVIRDLLTEYRKRRYPGQYAVSKTPDGSVLVFPEQVADQTGTLQKITPITKQKLALHPNSNEKLLHFLIELLKSLQDVTGKRVLLGGMSGPAFFQDADSSLCERSSTFADCLSEVATNLRVTFWQLLYEPADKMYVLVFR